MKQIIIPYEEYLKLIKCYEIVNKKRYNIYYQYDEEETKRLNNIINKAIEYIRQLEFESEELYDISEIARLELLDILKGSDKE